MVRYEETPKAERPYPDAAEGTLESICGIMRSVPMGDVEIPYHGDVRFYEYDTRANRFWEYIARFTEGRCVRIWCEDHGTVRPHQSEKAALASEGRSDPTQGGDRG